MLERFAIITLILLSAAGSVTAQAVPSSITYQGKLTDAAGQPVSDGSRSMVFKLYDAQTSGTKLWDSGALNVATSSGVFSVALGAAPTPAITSSTLTGDAVWLEVTVGTDTPMPRVQLSSAPFALRAADLTLPFSKTVSSSPSFTLAFEVKNTTANYAIRGESNNASFAGVMGDNTGSGIGVYGHSETGTAVRGYQQTSGNLGTLGTSQSGVLGSSGAGYGVWGYSASGSAGYFNIDGVSNSSPALYATTGGTGRAGRFEITNTGSNASALYAKTSGTGSSVWAESSTVATPLVAYNTGNPGNSAAYVEIFNSSNPNSALYSKTNGSGSAVYALNSGTTGRAGTFSVTHASNPSAALYATTSGTGPAAVLMGNVGIGTTSPTSKLDVAGNTKVSGELNVTGAFTGNIGPGGGGAPFPRPAFDSGWLNMLPGSIATFTHNLGGDPLSYIVDLERNASLNQGWGINNFGVGGWYDDSDMDRDWVGVWWCNLTSTTVEVRVGSDASGPQEADVRVRIWVVK